VGQRFSREGQSEVHLPREKLKVCHVIPQNTWENIVKSFFFAFIITLFGCSIGVAQQDSVFAAVSEDSVTIWNTGLEENCASRFTFSIVMLDSNVIIVTETDTVGPLVRCMCIYDLSLTLVGLGIGHYMVDVNRSYLVQYHYSKDTTIPIGSTSFDIHHVKSPAYSYQFHQSNCGGFDAVLKPRDTPAQFSLGFNYPNPFNPTTTIQYSTTSNSYVKLRVYDILGRQVATLVDGVEYAGEHTVQWNAGSRPSGVYFYRLETKDHVFTRPMLLMK
jgi:Secretion system C-terminal sorting domain